MKRFLSVLLLWATLTMSFAACDLSPDTEDNKNNTQNSTEESSDAFTTENKKGTIENDTDNYNKSIYTVTAEEWDSAFADKNLWLNYTCITEDTHPEKSVSRHNNGISHHINYYAENKSEEFYFDEKYRYDIIGDTVRKSALQRIEVLDTTIIVKNNPFVYDKYTYDTNSNSYKADSIILEYEQKTGIEKFRCIDTYTDVEIKFFKGKLVSYSYAVHSVYYFENEDAIEFTSKQTMTFGDAGEIIIPEATEEKITPDTDFIIIYPSSATTDSNIEFPNE